MSATIKSIKNAPKMSLVRQIDEFGDVFNANRFSKKYEGTLIFSQQRGEWYEFKNHAWRSDELRYVTQHAISVTKDIMLDAAKKMIDAAQGGGKSALEELVQHPFCKFFGCWFCAAVLAGALRACSARGAEDGTAARRNIDRPYPQAISSGHSYLYPRRNRQHGTTRRTSPSGGGFCGAAE